MARRKGENRPWILIFCMAGLAFLSACTAERKYLLLSSVFDGVPLPGAKAADQGETCACGNAAPQTEDLILPETAAIVEEVPPRPPIESVKTWEEAQAMLPKDMYNAVDWVKAIKDRVIEPRLRIDADAPPVKAPFTLDSIVPGLASDITPPFNLDIEIRPAAAPFYKVVFPHSSHTLWLNCSSCHPGIAAKRGSGMGKIFSGEYCGSCHGKVSFEPMTSCARCHVGLVPRDQETIEADLAMAETEMMPSSEEMLEHGKAVYGEVCAICHGAEGDGKGRLAESLQVKPRDFTSGLFKLRSNNSTSIPRDVDIFRTITRGIPNTSMPGFSFLSFEDRSALVHYVKTFSDIFSSEEAAEPISIPDPPEETPELLELGAKMYKEAGCVGCHGEKGDGNGPSAATLKDEWGEPIRPFNFASGNSTKTGPGLKDFYRDVMTGLQGTPMPDFGDIFEPEQAWAVVYYAYAFGKENRGKGNSVKGDILFTRGELNSGGAVDPDEIVPAKFPHWFHRIRVRCAVCHPNFFEMKAGANPVTMDAIRAGRYCGNCHPSYPNPKSLAWAVSFDSCRRCHVDQ